MPRPPFFRSISALVLLAAGLSLALWARAMAQQPQTRPVGDDAGRLEWVDKQTGRVLFSAADIKRFDWERQVFELSLDKTIDLEEYMFGQQHRAFVVRDAKGQIYEGHFVSGLSSVGYDGPAILTDGGRTPHGDTVFEIAAGYPAGKPQPAAARRFDQLAKTALEQARALGKIGDDYKAPPITRMSCQGRVTAGGVGIGGSVYSESFRIGQIARAHLLFFKEGKGAIPAHDKALVRVTVKNRDGQGLFTTDVVADGKLDQMLENRVWPLRLEPWNVGKTPLTAGRAEVTLQIVLVKDGKEQVFWPAAPREGALLTILPPVQRMRQGAPTKQLLDAADLARAIEPALPAKWSVTDISWSEVRLKEEVKMRAAQIGFYDGEFHEGMFMPPLTIWVMDGDQADNDKDRAANLSDLGLWRGKRVLCMAAGNGWPGAKEAVKAAMIEADRPQAAAKAAPPRDAVIRATCRFMDRLASQLPEGWELTNVSCRNAGAPSGWVGAEKPAATIYYWQPNRTWPVRTDAGGSMHVMVMGRGYDGKMQGAADKATYTEVGLCDGHRVFAGLGQGTTGQWPDLREDLAAAVDGKEAATKREPGK